MDVPRAMGCDDFGDDLAVLAVGALTGQDRARVLAHLEGCPSCAAELDELTSAADSLTDLVPDVVPPDGFSERTMVRIRAEQHQPSRLVGRRLVAAAAVVILLVVGGAAGAIVNSSAHHEPSTAVASAPLRSAVGTGGTVVLTSAGDRGWLVMTVEDAPTSGQVTCSLSLTDGSHRTVGRFTLSDGYGTWTAPIPVAVASVRRVTLVDASGAPVASAHIS